MKNFIHQMDEVIHQKVRLAMMTLLAANGEMDFTELKAQLQLTDGNLSSHVALLEKSKYVVVRKSFVGKRPRTTIVISKKGNTALQSHLEALRQLLENS